jgi:hypothetical protein
VDEKAVRGHPLWLYMITAEGTIKVPAGARNEDLGEDAQRRRERAATPRPRAVTSRQNATARSTSSAHSAARARSLPHHRPPVEQRHGITGRRVIDRQRARAEKESPHAVSVVSGLSECGGRGLQAPSHMLRRAKGDNRES